MSIHINQQNFHHFTILISSHNGCCDAWTHRDAHLLEATFFDELVKDGYIVPAQTRIGGPRGPKIKA